MRTFCCCLPVRLGALLLSALQLVLSGGVAAIAWREVFVTGIPAGTERTALIVVGAVFTFMALVSAFGFIGSLVRARVLVAMFATMLYILVALSLGSGIWSVWSLFHGGGQEFLDACAKQESQLDLAQAKSLAGEGNVDKVLESLCHGALDTIRIVYIVVLSITILIQLYCAYIVKEYAAQLGDEEDRKQMKAAAMYNVSQPQPVVINNMYGHQQGTYGGAKV
ncbi:hypothetical protein EXIGLDRAFT_829732 [Exidia glandulosa HHB12029]|uniref:Tetraspannin-domain-containing protein n=1 Tax=Exidia glandulosa HHB12029 TaxID=1314781 RepID=A0A165P8J9_EXIGL|nr:hypothetical protein EXIGLDRAFT_829732 [Exidia glandulosa HHB12029]